MHMKQCCCWTITICRNLFAFAWFGWTHFAQILSPFTLSTFMANDTYRGWCGFHIWCRNNVIIMLSQQTWQVQCLVVHEWWGGQLQFLGMVVSYNKWTDQLLVKPYLMFCATELCVQKACVDNWSQEITERPSCTISESCAEECSRPWVDRHGPLHTCAGCSQWHSQASWHAHHVCSLCCCQSSSQCAELTASLRFFCPFTWQRQ